MNTNEKVNKLIEDVSKLTVLELADLVKKLKERFDVKDMQPVQQPLVQEQLEKEEQTEFDVILKETGEKRIAVLKVIRQLTGAGLKEAKDIIDNVPNTIKEQVPKAEAEDARQQLIAVGATIELK